MEHTMAHPAIIRAADSGKAIGIKDRIVVVHSVVHQAQGQDGDPYQLGYQRYLETKDAALKKPITLGQDWEVINTYWLEECSMLIIQNNEGQGLHRRPTEAEQKDIALRVIQVSFYTPSVQLMPGKPRPTKKAPRDMHSPPLEEEQATQGQPIELVPHLYIPPGEDMRICPYDTRLIAIRSEHGSIKATVIAYPI
jgi:hypothetical protein